MTNKDIKIIIVGAAGTGKSTIAFLIKNMLNANDIKIMHDATPDFKNETDFDNHFIEENRINKIMDSEFPENLTVYLSEEQANRMDVDWTNSPFIRKPIGRPIISMIAAVAGNGVIGKENTMPWHISADLKRFKELTLGKPVIMGRKTYESLPFKPLPGRKNIIITNNRMNRYEGAITVTSPEEALNLCRADDEVFICGGAQIYNRFINLADKMYITMIFKSFDGDVKFPEIYQDDWLDVKKSTMHKDEKSGLEYIFVDYKR